VTNQETKAKAHFGVNQPNQIKSISSIFKISKFKILKTLKRRNEEKKLRN